MNTRRNLLRGATVLIGAGALLAACKSGSGGVVVDLATAQLWAGALKVAAVNALADVMPKLNAAQQAKATADEAALNTAVAQFQAIPPGGQGTTVAQQVITVANQFVSDVPVGALSPSTTALMGNIQLGLTVLAAFVAAVPLAAIPATP